MATFDWYQATVQAPVNDVLEACLAGLGERVTMEHTAGRQGYLTTTRLLDGDGLCGQVLHGGTHQWPHVVFTSDAAPQGASVIRDAFGGIHFVTRADVCEDFSEVDAFDRMQAIALGVAHRHRLTVDTRGDHLLRKEARTLYLGSAKSAVRLRQYDKAAELRAKFSADPMRLAAVPASLTRVEAQVRPATREAREQFAAIEPVAVMGSAGWLREFWEAVAGLQLVPVQVGKAWRASDDDRAWNFMLAQYGSMLHRRKREHGTWECVGLQIGSDLAARKKARR